MKKGQQQEPLQDQIERLEDEINDAIHKVEENSLFAPGCVRRQPYRAHLGHKWAAKCVLEHILSHTGELQEEVNRMYDEAFYPRTDRPPPAGLAAPTAPWANTSRVPAVSACLPAPPAPGFGFGLTAPLPLGFRALLMLDSCPSGKKRNQACFDP